ncbi:MAG: LptF/LptG family permease [Holosporales bacterium]|nr:LptF/LptG family permease [Holosporales bacterium]
MISNRVFDLYILKKFFSVLLIISPIVVIMVWITVSIRHITLIVSEDVSISIFLRFILCTFPDIASVILPTCSIIASISVLHKMQADKELLVFMTSGSGIFSFLKPIFFFFFCIASIVFFIQSSLTPYTHKNLIRLQDKIHSQISMSVIKQGVFNVVGDSVIYIGKKTENTIEDVFISYIPKGGKMNTNIITAKSGHYVVDRDNLFITLDNGYRQELDENNSMISMLSFENFTYNVSQFVKKYTKRKSKIYENTQSELLAMAKKIENLELRNKYLAEYHGRIAVSLIPFINAAISLMFVLTSGIRSRRSMHSVGIFLFGVIFQIIVMILVNASSKYSPLIHINYLIIFLIISMIILITLRKKAK